MKLVMNAMKKVKNKITFLDYLKKFRKEDSIVGDFASDTYGDNALEERFLKNNKASWDRYLDRTGVCLGAVEAFEEAWYLYKKELLNRKLRSALRSRLTQAIRQKNKSVSAVNDLGCTIDEFIIYIENQFTKGMGWHNWAKDGWHIDHVIPLSSFDLTDLSQIIRAVHHTNLQPLWAKDNHSKHAKLNWVKPEAKIITP